MARGRMLNVTVCASVKFCNLPDDTCRLLATWLISHLDKNGVFYGDPGVVKSLIFPRRLDVTVEQVAGYLAAMQEQGLICLFAADGDLWQCWPGFAENQPGLRPERETTTFPTPPGDNGGEDPAPVQPARGEDTGKTPEEIQQDPASSPQARGDDAAELNLTELKRSEVKRREEKTEDGAEAPSPPTTLSAWLELLEKSTNKVATVRWAFEVLYPGRSPPEYSYIGRVARTVGGAGRLVDLLWRAVPFHPTGDVLRYVQGMAKKSPGPRETPGQIAARIAREMEGAEDGDERADSQADRGSG